MFNNNVPVLIKPMGLLVSGDQFGRSARLFLSQQERLELVRDNLDGAATVLVRRVNVFKASVTFTLPSNLLTATNADAYNEKLEEDLKALVEEEIEERHRAVVTEPVARKRGRPASRKKVEETEESEEDDKDDVYFDKRMDELLKISHRAYTLDIEEVTVASADAIPLRNSSAYDYMVGRNEDNKTTINQKLAQVVNLVNVRAAKMAELAQFGDSPAQLEPLMSANYAGDDLEDTRVGLLDQQALGGARQTLRNQLNAVENQIRALYDWLDRNVVTKFNKNSAQTELPFKQMDFDGAASLVPSEIVQELFTQILVPVN